ncbi:hypothetical protein PGB90_003393 [Kerria lacca]
MASGIVSRFKPLFDRVLIQKAEKVTTTKGGIMLPEKAIGKVLEGVVIAVGPGARSNSGDFIAPQLKVGDKVLLPEYGGTKVELEEKEYHIFREADLLAKLE